MTCWRRYTCEKPGLKTQLEFFFRPEPTAPPDQDTLAVGARQLPLHLIRHRRARRYLLRVKPDGTVRVTIPRGGSVEFARNFAHQHLRWIEDQLAKLATRPIRTAEWRVNDTMLFRGENVRLGLIPGAEPVRIQFADQEMDVADPAANLRPAIERRLRQLAESELMSRTWELALRCANEKVLGGSRLRRVVIRNQRTRWGSCSAKGTVSLNWRLIQAPPAVRDYLILHELMHLREMNHSPRFWAWVQRVCPDYAESERWLKQHGRLLR